MTTASELRRRRALGAAGWCLAGACVVATLASAPPSPPRRPTAPDTGDTEPDPFPPVSRGRELFLREFGDADGVLGPRVAHPLLEDGRTPVVPGDRVPSCRLCHNVPFRDAGAGATIRKNGESGRNTPHLFGAGLVEMIGWELRRRLLVLADADRDGLVTADEARAAPAAVVDGVDFGRFDDRDGDGRPDLNPVCRVTYRGAGGVELPWARRLDDPDVAGYSVEVQVFGWGHTPASRAPLSPTLRGFSAAAFNVHSGLQAHDAVLDAAATSGAGAPQFPSGRTPGGGASADPDGDGVASELTTGDLDALEAYLLHHPQPAELAPTPRTRRGRERFAEYGCATCHVETWRLPAADGDDVPRDHRATGDRRRFAVDVAPDAAGAIRGRVVPATPGGALVVRGVFSDFRHHDLGPAFHQRQFDGSVQTRFRTPPLWGVGSTAPYGHDGASLDLDAAIRRHGGEAAAASAAFAAAPEEDREALLAFLRSLVLYSVDGSLREDVVNTQR